VSGDDYFYFIFAHDFLLRAAVFNPDSSIESTNRGVFIASNCFSRTNEFVSATQHFAVGAGLAPALGLPQPCLCYRAGASPAPTKKNAPCASHFIRSEQSHPNPNEGFSFNQGL
jgi:hypothetical protein